MPEHNLRTRLIPLYQCDINKNTSCDQTYCAYNSKALCQSCTGTTRRDCAVLDETGSPVIIGYNNGNYRVDAEK